MARRYWPGEDPLGQRVSIRFGGDALLEVVGLVGDTQQSALDAQTRPEIYVPITQRPWFFMTYAIRTSADPTSLAALVRNQVWSVDRDIPIYNLASMEQRVSDSVAKRRFNMFLVGSFAVIALLLAAVGIYGVVSHSVSQRTQEIGVRLALGATQHDVLRLVIRQGMSHAFFGAAIGLAAAFALSRLLATQLFGIAPTDPITFTAVPLLLLAVALLACYLPARRAAQVDPMRALKYD